MLPIDSLEVIYAAGVMDAEVLLHKGGDKDVTDSRENTGDIAEEQATPGANDEVRRGSNGNTTGEGRIFCKGKRSWSSVHESGLRCRLPCSAHVVPLQSRAWHGGGGGAALTVPFVARPTSNAPKSIFFPGRRMRDA